MLDKKTYSALGLVIANKLMAKGWYMLGNAIICDQATPSEVAGFLDDKMDKITKLRKYHTNPSRTLEDIRNITGYDYKNLKNGTIMHIANDFIQFLINDQIDKFVFIDDAYIYDYEKVLEEKEKMKNG